jgi:hypothetical protein
LAAVTAQAAPIDFKAVPAEAKWLAHVDVDAMRSSMVVQKMYHMAAEKCKDLDVHMDKVKEHLGLDPRKDLHGMTLYGPRVGEHRGILIVYADVDRKLLEEKAQRAPDHKTATYGSYEIHTWMAKHMGKEHPAAGAFFKSNVIVFGPSADGVKLALDVLDGKKSSLDGKESVLTAKVPAGTTVLARAIDLGDAKLPVKSPLVKESQSLSIAMGESEGKSFFHGSLATKSTDVAEQVKKIVEGGLALGRLQHGNDAEATKLIDQVKVKVSDKNVAVDFEASADTVAAKMQQCAKQLHERHQKWMERLKKAKEADKK